MRPWHTGGQLRGGGFGGLGLHLRESRCRDPSPFQQGRVSQKNEWFADNGEVIYHIESVDQVGTSTEYLAVTLTLTYEDGSSSARTTYFVYQNGVWKHRFRQEKQDLFGPHALPTRNSSRLNSRGWLWSWRAFG